MYAVNYKEIQERDLYENDNYTEIWELVLRFQPDRQKRFTLRDILYLCNAGLDNDYLRMIDSNVHAVFVECVVYYMIYPLSDKEYIELLDCLHKTFSNGSFGVDIIYGLIDRIEPNQRKIGNSINGDTLLITLAKEEEIEEYGKLYDFFYKKKFDLNVNHVNKDGKSALTCAHFNNHERLIEYLIHNGADHFSIGNYEGDFIKYVWYNPYNGTEYKKYVEKYASVLNKKFKQTDEDEDFFMKQKQAEWKIEDGFPNSKTLCAYVQEKIREDNHIFIQSPNIELLFRKLAGFDVEGYDEYLYDVIHVYLHELDQVVEDLNDQDHIYHTLVYMYQSELLETVNQKKRRI